MIRHYDVTGKNCPKYFVENEDAWEQFKLDVKTALATPKEEKKIFGLIRNNKFCYTESIHMYSGTRQEMRNTMKNMNKKMLDYNIVLIGFMGAGKSTVSAYLNKEYGMEVIEMDQVIAEREKMSISDIFAVHGEEYFRNLETNLLIEMQSQTNKVISCGGGVAMRDRNVKEMKKNGRVVLLTAAPETILERVKDSDDRPLLNGHKDVDYIGGLMEVRRPKYEAASDIVVSTDQKRVSEICEEMMQKLKEMDEKDV